MPDTIDAIQRRLELAGYLPEQFGNGNSAADRWREDVTTLLAEIKRLNEALDMVAEEREAWKARVLGMTPAPCRHNDHVHITDAWQT